MIDNLEQQNYYTSEKDCEDLFESLHEKIKEKLLANEYKDFKQLGNDWDYFRKVYKENSKGPAKNEVGERLGLNKMYEDADHYLYMNKQDVEKLIAELK